MNFTGTGCQLNWIGDKVGNGEGIAAQIELNIKAGIKVEMNKGEADVKKSSSRGETR